MTVQDDFLNKQFLELKAEYCDSKILLFNLDGEECQIKGIGESLFFVVDNSGLRKSGKSVDGEQISTTLKKEYGLSKSKSERVKNSVGKLPATFKLYLFGKGALDEKPLIERLK